MRFTVDGSDALENRIASDLDAIRAAVLDAVGRDEIQALLLGGGYGRGEGGVFLDGGEERVYNDYDLFVIVPYASRFRRKALARKLDTVKAAIEPVCGIHVDFGPPMPFSSLRHLPYELMFMELKAGHHVFLGPTDVLESMPEYAADRPPLEEGARLFMNRGYGLLLAGQRITEGRPLDKEAHEFVVRNIYKALQAVGDSVLFVRGAYNPSYVTRRANFLAQDLADIPCGDAVSHHYESALDFKLRPDHAVPDGKSLLEWHREAVGLYCSVFLWFEKLRLVDSSLTWRGYSERSCRLPSLSGEEKLKNLYRNVRSVSVSIPRAKEWFLHPRDRVLSRLPEMLSTGNIATSELALVTYLWERYG